VRFLRRRVHTPNRRRLGQPFHVSYGAHRCLQSAGAVWDEETEFLKDPIRGSKMGFVPPIRRQRADLIAFLKAN
jgi:cytochrome c2